MSNGNFKSMPTRNVDSGETPEQRLRKVSKILFEKLSSIYSSPHFPNPDERLQAILVLENALKENVDPMMMIEKMKLLEAKTQFKTKVHNVIVNKFWEMTLKPSVRATMYDPKNNL
jgi:hypothetical protein